MQDDQIRIGDAVAYRSFAGPVYDAVVTKVWPNGFYDLCVLIPELKEPMPLAAVRAARVAPKEKP